MRLTPGSRRPRAPRGFTLIELVVAITVLSIGTLAVLRATDQSARVLGQAMPRLLAQIAAENRAEEQHLPGAAQPALVTLGPETIRIETATLPTAAGLLEMRITATSQSGPGVQIVTYLPGTGGGP